MLFRSEYTLHTYTVRDLTNGERGGGTIALRLDHIALERLDTLLGSFNDLVVDGNVITGFESRIVLGAGELLVDILYRVRGS